MGCAETSFAQTNWTLDADGVWQVATNWNPATIPNIDGGAVLLGSVITGERTIRLGDNVLLGSLTITNANNYKISGLYNPQFSPFVPGSASITVNGTGSPLISSKIDLYNDLVITQNSSGTFTISGDFTVAGQSISKYGAGVLELTGNGYFGNGLNILQGTVRAYMEQSLGNGTNITLNGGVLNLGANVTTDGSRTYTIGASGGTLNIDSPYSLIFGGGTKLLGSGILTKSGGGTLTLSSDNSATFTGTSVSILGGTIKISAENNLGALGNDVTLNGGTLNITSGFTANAGKVFTFGASGGTLDIDRDQTLVLGTASQISGSGNFTKLGLGTITISGDNSSSFTGSTIINNGTVRVTAENNLGSLSSGVTINGGTLNVGGSFTANATKVVTIGASGGTIDVDSGITLTLGSNNQLVGTSTFNKNGAGTLAITGNLNTSLTGFLDINAGTVSISGASGSATGITSTIVTGATLLLDNSTAVVADRIAGTVTLDGGTIKLAGNTSATSETIGALNLIGGASTIDIQRSGTLGTTLTFGSLSQSASDATVHFNTSGTGTLGTDPKIVFTTAPTLVNSLIGGWATAVSTNGGSLEFATYTSGSVAALATYNTGSENTWVSGSNTKPGSSQTLSANRTNNSLNLTSGINVVLNGKNLTIESGGLIKSGATASTISGTGFITVGTPALGGQLYTHIDTGATLTISSIITNNSTGIVDLIKAGGGTLVLSGGNTYTGGTFVNKGTVRIGAANSLADTSYLDVESGATFDLNNFSEAVGSIRGSGSITLGTGTLTTGTNGTADAFSGIISGTGGLTKIGTEVLNLSGTNTYSGNTVINNGILQIARESHLGAATNDIIFGGGTLNVTESFTANTSKVLTMTGAGTIDVDSGKTVTFTSTNNLIGSSDLTKAGLGTLTLAGGSNYTGNLVINAGELKVQGTAANVATLLTTNRVNNLSGLGGTLTWSYSNENLTNTISIQPSTASNVKIGFDAVYGQTNLYYVFGPTNGNLNWAGLVVKGGKVNLSSDHKLVGTAATTLEISGGDLYLAGSNPSGGKTLEISGDATLSGGFLHGGPLGGSHGTLITAGNIISTGTILVNSPDVVMKPASGVTTTISGSTPFNGVAAFTKTGGGTVRLDQSMTANTIEINQGTLLLGASDRLNDDVTVTLKGGGTIATGGYKDVVGALTLGVGGGTLDLGSGTNSLLGFADSRASAWGGYTLTITNYIDSSEHIYFGTTASGLTSTQLAEIVWQNPYGTNSSSVYYGATIDADGRIRPVPIPEPATILAILLLGGLISWHERVRLKSIVLRLNKFILA